MACLGPHHTVDITTVIFGVNLFSRTWYIHPFQNCSFKSFLCFGLGEIFLIFSHMFWIRMIFKRCLATNQSTLFQTVWCILLGLIPKTAIKKTPSLFLESKLLITIVVMAHLQSGHLVTQLFHGHGGMQLHCLSRKMIRNQPNASPRTYFVTNRDFPRFVLFQSNWNYFPSLSSPTRRDQT